MGQEGTNTASVSQTVTRAPNSSQIFLADHSRVSWNLVSCLCFHLAASVTIVLKSHCEIYSGFTDQPYKLFTSQVLWSCRLTLPTISFLVGLTEKWRYGYSPTFRASAHHKIELKFSYAWTSLENSATLTYERSEVYAATQGACNFYLKKRSLKWFLDKFTCCVVWLNIH